MATIACVACYTHTAKLQFHEVKHHCESRGRFWFVNYRGVGHVSCGNVDCVLCGTRWCLGFPCMQRLCCVYSADPAWLPGCTKACSTHAAVSRVLTAHLHIQNAVQYSVNCSTNYVLTTQNQHSVIHLTKMECDLWYCVYMYMFEIKHASQNGQCHVDNST